MPVHPQVQEVLDQFSALGIPELSALPVDELRTLTEAMNGQRAADAPAVEEVRDLSIPGPVGDIPARLYRPAGAAGGVLVWFHGGGWVIGSIDGSDGTCRYLADAAGVAIISVGYRLGPEHPFPAAVVDCFAATEWVAENAESLGLGRGRLAVGGDSAGGNLAAVVSLLARDEGGPEIGLQALVYPATDARMGWPSIEENGEGYFLTKDDMKWFMGNYGLGSVVEAADWRLSPLLASSHANLPPALIVTAEFDPLRDEGQAYADALRAAGVDVTVAHYDGMIHAFFGMRGVVDAAEDAQKTVAAAVREALVD
jgi:acetyl esterase/lipase